MANVLYATLPDLRSVLSGTDSGTGTPAQLSDTQLTLALTSASNRVSIYSGNVWDSSVPAAVPPAALHDLTLDLAAFYAWRTYLKGKEIPQAHPAYIAYKDAMQLLADSRDGKLRLDPVTFGGVGDETGIVINRIPPIFSGEDSNTELDQMTGLLKASSPLDQWTPQDDLLGDMGPVYQG